MPFGAPLCCRLGCRLRLIFVPESRKPTHPGGCQERQEYESPGRSRQPLSLAPDHIESFGNPRFDSKCVWSRVQADSITSEALPGGNQIDWGQPFSKDSAVGACFAACLPDRAPRYTPARMTRPPIRTGRVIFSSSSHAPTETEISGIRTNM